MGEYVTKIAPYNASYLYSYLLYSVIQKPVFVNNFSYANWTDLVVGVISDEMTKEADKHKLGHRDAGDGELTAFHYLYFYPGGFR